MSQCDTDVGLGFGQLFMPLGAEAFDILGEYTVVVGLVS